MGAAQSSGAAVGAREGGTCSLKRKAAAVAAQVGLPLAGAATALAAAAAAASSVGREAKRQRTVSCDLAKPNTYQITITLTPTSQHPDRV